MTFKITRLAPDVIDGTATIEAYYSGSNPEESLQCNFCFEQVDGEPIQAEQLMATAKAFLLKVANEL